MNGVFVHLYLPSEFLQLENITLTVIGQYNKSKPQLVKTYFFYYFLFLFIFLFFLCVCVFFWLFLFCCCLFLIFRFFRLVLFYFVFLFFVFCCCCFALFNGHFLVHCYCCFLQFNLLVVLFPKPSVWVLIIWRSKLGFLKDIILK